MKIYSERLPLKYLFSNRGVCLGIDTKRASFLFLVSSLGVMFRKRPVGDRVVEDNNYDIPVIFREILKGK